MWRIKADFGKYNVEQMRYEPIWIQIPQIFNTWKQANAYGNRALDSFSWKIETANNSEEN